jgi:predicted transcriptional regulator
MVETSEQLTTRTRLREIAAARKLVEEGEAPAIIAALEVGVRQSEIARDLGRGREHIRRIARANGIEAPGARE